MKSFIECFLTNSQGLCRYSILEDFKTVAINDNRDTFDKFNMWLGQLTF